MPVRPDRVSQLAVLNANCSEVNVAISRGDVHWKGTAFLGPDLPASSFPTISPHQSLYEKGESPPMSTNLPADAKHAPQLIPGGYDRTTLTHRQSGSMGGSAFGSANVSIGPGSMDAATIADREREGGGAPNQRRPNNVDQRPVLGTSFFHYIRSFGVHVMHLRPLHDRIKLQRLDEESTQRIGTIVAIQERSL